MGASASIGLRPEEIEELTDLTGFSRRRIALLYRRFNKLDRDNDGVITESDLLSIPELAMNPLSKRMVALLDRDGSSGSINFRSFLTFLSVFGKHKRYSDERYSFLFKLYDVDTDGTISKEDLRSVLKLQVGDWCSDTQLSEVVDRTHTAADINRDGKVTFDDFVAFMSRDAGENNRVSDILNFRLGEDPFEDNDDFETDDIF